MRRIAVLCAVLLVLSACSGTDADGTSGRPAEASPLTLEETASVLPDPSTQPYVTFDADEGWTQTIADEHGIDQWTHDEGCLVTTGNLVDDAPTDATDDRTRTREILDGAEGALSAMQDVSSADAEPVVVPHGEARPVEFAVRTVDYTAPDDGTTWRTWYASRATVTDRLVLSINITCPRSVVDAAPERFDDIAAALRITDAAAQ